MRKMRFTHLTRFATLTALTVIAAPLALAGCSASDGADLTTVTVVTHDSFDVPEDVLADFERESGLTVTFVAPGDAGALVNQLILTQDSPLGDVVFGIDNTFASRAIDAGVLSPVDIMAPAFEDAATYGIPGSDRLVAIDYSDVCINVDHRWFTEHELAEPVTLADLTRPEYKGLLSVPNPATSSPGLAFLLATVASDPEHWEEYWAALRANDVRVVASWSDAYFTDFSGPSTGGDYPLVVSYASSPPFEVGDTGEAPTGALLETCFRQVEYAGVLAGGQNPDGARLVIEWMLSDAFQSSVAESMYVYPVSTTAEIPESWVEFAPLSEEPWTITPDEIAAHRDEWIRTWTSVVLD